MDSRVECGVRTNNYSEIKFIDKTNANDSESNFGTVSIETQVPHVSNPVDRRANVMTQVGSAFGQEALVPWIKKYVKFWQV